MDKLFKSVLIALIFSVVLFSGCKKNKAPDAPLIPSGPTSGSINTEYTFSSSAEDPDEDSVAIRFIWGDGDTSAWSTWQASEDSISMSHSWSNSGTYSIKAQAEDMDEAVSDWSDSVKIIIGNPPNTPATPAGDSIGSINVGYSFVSTTTHSNGDSFAIRFDWGNGDTSIWSSFVPSGDAVLMTHYWSVTGNYNIKAQAKDKKNATSNWSAGHPIQIAAGWSKTLGGPYQDYGYSVQQTMDGGYIITGESDSYCPGNSDVYLIKTDVQGNQKWFKTFGGTGIDAGNSVQVTSEGAYIIVGNTQSYGGGSQIFLIKYDHAGDTVWTKTKGFNDWDDYGYSVQQTEFGGYIIVGSTHVLDPYLGHWQVFLIWTDVDGNTEGYDLKGYDYSNEYGYSVQITSDLGFILTGWTDHFDADGDVWLVKTDANGATEWSNHFGGAGDDCGYSVQQTSDGGYIITGSTQFLGTGDYDLYLIKTDANGNQQWSKTFGGPSDDYGRSVQQTTDGGYIIAGSTYSYGAGSADVYLIKTNVNGDTLWTRTFGGSGDDRGHSVQQTSDGGYIITGATQSSGAGGYDVYLIKTDANGNVK